MQRIDDPSNVPTKPPPLATVSPGYFRRPSVLAGDQGTIVTADWVNDVQEAIVHPILAAGLPLTKGSVDQLTAAIGLLANSLVTAHNAIGATEGVVGHARFGTTSEVLAQVLNSVAISPLRLKQAFPASITSPGFVQIPTTEGNVVVNFGSQVVGSNSTATVTLARAYTTGAIARFATLDISANPGASADCSAWDTPGNLLTQISIRNATGNGQPLSWFSIGI